MIAGSYICKEDYAAFSLLSFIDIVKGQIILVSPSENKGMVSIEAGPFNKYEVYEDEVKRCFDFLD